MRCTCLLSQLSKGFYTFVIDIDRCDYLLDFVLMSEMGFFLPTGDRYQMVQPTKLDIDNVKRAHLKLAATEGADWVHPERLIVSMPWLGARRCQCLLRNMKEENRLADRRAILFLD